MKNRKWIPLLMLLAVILTALPLTAEAAKVKLNKTKVTQICNTAMTVLELKNATNGKVVWKSSNKKVVTCDAGGNHCIILSHKAGKAKITAKYKGKKYTCKVTVKDKPQITLKKLSLYTGIVTEDNYISVYGTAKKVKWSVSNKSILSVTNAFPGTCIVKGLKPGTAKVIATAGKKKLTCTVTVADKKLSAAGVAYKKILTAQNPSGFDVMDIDDNGTPELITADVSDSTLTLNIYCYAGGAAKAAGKITVNRGEWEFFDVSAGNGYITLDGVKKGQNTSSWYHYLLKDNLLSVLIHYEDPGTDAPTIMELNGKQINADDDSEYDRFWEISDDVETDTTIIVSNFLDFSENGGDDIIAACTPENMDYKLQ